MFKLTHVITLHLMKYSVNKPFLSGPYLVVTDTNSNTSFKVCDALIEKRQQMN